MNFEIHQLNWQGLAHTKGGIPWQLLDDFTNALIANPDIWRTLADRHEHITQTRHNYRGYEELYIPAIFAKAADKLDENMRLQISQFLVDKLCEAGFDDADIMLETLSAACGSFGVTVLPAVIDAIEREPDTQGAWIFLFALLRLAKDTDKEIRNKVINLCGGMLEKADNGQLAIDDVDFVTGILAEFGAVEYLDVLKSLEKKSGGTFFAGEYKEAIAVMEGKKVPDDYKELWQLPVSEWLESRWKLIRDWDEKNKDTEDEIDELALQFHNAEKLAWKFMRSDTVRKKSQADYQDTYFIVSEIVYYACEYEGVSPEEFNQANLKNLLLHTLPRKVTAERELFEKIPPVVAEFLEWLQACNKLPEGEQLAEKVRGLSEEIVSNAMNPNYWGMAKSFAMQAQADGVDISDTEEFEKYIANYQFQQIANQEVPEKDPPENFSPIVPIKNTSPKVGRNQPCPCGSGKKYKKCCGKIKN